MASEEVRKRNVRLEAFLKRALDVDAYERIRTHDACIVCSERDKRAFKFIIISDEWIYLSENPPKKLSPVIHFRDVVSISMATDVAEFLSGAEQENAQHIIIKYKTDAIKMTSRDKEVLETERATQRDMLLLTARAMKSNRPDALSYVAKHGYAKSYLSTSQDTSRHVKFDLKPTNQRLASSATDLKVASHDTFEQENESMSKTTNMKSRRVTKNLTQNNSKKHSGRRTKGLSKSMDEQVLRDVLTSKEDVSQNGDTAHLLSDEKKLKTGKKTHSKKAEINSEAKSQDNGDLHLNLGADSDEGEGPANGSAVVVPPLDLNGLDQAVTPRTPRSILRSANRGIIDEDASDGNGIREGVFHLYILDGRSKVLMYIHSAWDSYIIRATLEEDPGYMTRRALFPPRDGPGASERLERLFNELKAELMLPSNQLEEVFLLTREMKMGTERNFAIKRFFWKDRKEAIEVPRCLSVLIMALQTAEMFHFFVNQLKKYLPSSESLKNGDQALLRADELEFVLLILETLAIMFRETEIFPARVRHLRHNEGRELHDLLYLLTCDPQLAAADTLASTELVELNEEITARATGLLFELITLAGQSNVGEAERCFISIAWIVESLESRGTMFQFTERLVRQALLMIVPTNRDELSPEEAILLYHQFRVLATFTHYSNALLAFIQEKFYEEFKYYVHATVIHCKLPSCYLIRPYVMKDIETVISRILTPKTTVRRLPKTKLS